MSKTIQGLFERKDEQGDSQAIDNATAKLWPDNATFQNPATGVAVYPPIQGTAIPTGMAADATVLTGPANGGMGAYRFTAVPEGSYWVSVQNGLDEVVWESVIVPVAPATVNAPTIIPGDLHVLGGTTLDGGILNAAPVIGGNVDSTNGIILPLYIYPSNIFTNADYNQVIDLKKKYNKVPLTTILNPASGPGTVADGNFTYAIRRLHGAGATVVGYVSTAYGVRDIGLVKTDVDTWLTLYPEIDGIFFDEMNNVVGGEAYYAELLTYSHNEGCFPVIGNPGAGVPESYFLTQTADVIVVYESATPPTEATLKGDYADGYASHPYYNRGCLVYGAASLDLSLLLMMGKYSGLVYITSGTSPNPWATLPSYLESLFSSLASQNDHTTSVKTGKGGVAGNLQLIPADNSASAITTITQTPDSASRTYTIPASGANASFVMTQGSQTIWGAKTFSSTATFNAPVLISDAVYITFGTGSGTKIGSSSSQKFAFWNTTPVVQQVLATGAGKTVDDVIALLQTLGLCRQS